jgi:hypothetical protein
MVNARAQGPIHESESCRSHFFRLFFVRFRCSLRFSVRVFPPPNEKSDVVTMATSSRIDEETLKG